MKPLVLLRLVSGGLRISSVLIGGTALYPQNDAGLVLGGVNRKFRRYLVISLMLGQLIGWSLQHKPDHCTPLIFQRECGVKGYCIPQTF